MSALSGVEWLDCVYVHYGRLMVTPVYVAAEILLGLSDPAEVAGAISRRGRKVGDDEMAATSAADVADAVEELIGLGFLGSVFSAASPVSDDCEEHVLELRLPG